MNKELEKALSELNQIKTDDGILSFNDLIDFSKKEVPKPEIVEVNKVDANAIITITKKNMLARIRLTPPLEGGMPITKDIIEKALRDNNVIYGIEKSYIERLTTSPIYDKSFIIAKGIEPVNGDDEFVEFLLDKKNNLKPLILENGNVDYKNLSYGNSVEINTVLGLLYPPTMGIDGRDILGNIIPAIPGKFLRYSPIVSGAHLDDDNCTILSSIAGNVMFKKGKIKVNKELVLKTVDLSTGNIVFAGDVRVLGDILEGFEIKCQGNITIAGLVENATLISGGDIVVAQGIHGENAKIFAEGGVRSHFIEFATVQCMESIYADYILNAKVTSGDRIIVKGENGYCVGGVCTSAKGIEINILGNETNIATKVQIVKPDTEDPEIVELHEIIEKYTNEVFELTKAWRNVSRLPISLSEKEKTSKLISDAKKQTVQNLNEAQNQLDKLEIENEKKMKRYILIREKVYPNILIKIDNLETRNILSRDNCCILVRNNEIVYGDVITE